MNNKLIIKKDLKNVKGKRLVQKVIQEYSSYIIEIIMENPDFLQEITTALEITEEDFYKYLSGEMDANITFYDQALVLCKKKLKENNVQ